MGRLIEKAEDGHLSDLEQEVPAMLIQIGNYWQQRYWEGQIEDLKLETQAHRLAVRHSLEELRAKVATVKSQGASASAQHLDGLDRMGTGTRPTASAVAGEGAASTFQALRPLERACEIAEEAAVVA
jgi:hypothetical protein